MYTRVSVTLKHFANLDHTIERNHKGRVTVTCLSLASLSLHWLRSYWWTPKSQITIHRWYALQVCPSIILSLSSPKTRLKTSHFRIGKTLLKRARNALRNNKFQTMKKEKTKTALRNRKMTMKVLNMTGQVCHSGEIRISCLFNPRMLSLLWFRIGSICKCQAWSIKALSLSSAK